MEFTGVGGFPKTQSKHHAQGKTQSPTLVYRHFWLQIRWGSSSEVVGYNIFSAKLKKSRHDPETSWFNPNNLGFW